MKSSTMKFALLLLVPVLAVPAVRAQGNDHHDDHRQEASNNQGGPGFQFHDQDRGQFQGHYNKDIQKYKKSPQSRRGGFSRGQRIPAGTRFQAVPSSYYAHAQPLPPGYRYGYSNGYVVAYNPTTQIIADVLDLVSGN